MHYHWREDVTKVVLEVLRSEEGQAAVREAWLASRTPGETLGAPVELGAIYARRADSDSVNDSTQAILRAEMRLHDARMQFGISALGEDVFDDLRQAAIALATAVGNMSGAPPQPMPAARLRGLIPDLKRGSKVHGLCPDGNVPAGAGGVPREAGQVSVEHQQRDYWRGRATHAEETLANERRERRAARDRLAALEQTAGEVCDSCRWAYRGDGTEVLLSASSNAVEALRALLPEKAPC